MPNLKKELWKEYSTDRLKVYIVDGDAVSKDNILFVGGGHSRVYDWIPKGEIWIAKELNEFDRKSTLLRELTVYRLMGKGLKYDDAHEQYSNPTEFKSHNDIENLDRMLEEEWHKVKDDMGGESIYNGVKHLFSGSKGYTHHHHKKMHHDLVRKHLKKEDNFISKSM